MEKREDIDKTLKLLYSVENFIVDLIIALKDGVQFKDVFEMFEAMKKLTEGIRGVKEAIEELKDLDDNEIKKLLEETSELSYNIFMAIKKS